MNKFITQGNHLIVLVIVLLMLQACGGGEVRNQNNRAINNQQSLEALIKQAQQASAERKGPLLVQAAGLLVLEQRYEKAQELLIHVNQQTLTPLQMDDFYLHYGEVLLALAASERSLNQLKTVTNPAAKSIEWQIRYGKALSDSYLANGNYFEAAKLRIELTDMIDNSHALAENSQKTWEALNQIETDFLQQLISDFNSRRVNGWLEIVYLNKRWGYHPERLLSELALWKQRYPLHPSMVHQPETLKRAAAAEEISAKRIAVLLPLSGKLASFGKMIHDGIVAAHYQSASSEEAPLLSFYDTAKHLSPLTTYNQAIDDGADFIIGPLTKESVEAILDQEALATPILALNQLEEQKYQHPLAFQFGLPVEDEAVQAAHFAFEKGYRKAVAFLPDTSTGERAQKAFQAYFEQLGGELIQVQTYKEKKKIKQDVQQMLGVDKSIKRKSALQRLLGRNLEFEMRRRQDADFIFLHARPEDGRMIKPFINYYFAHDLPVIATSAVFSGKKDPQTDIDLNGIEFPHIPLLLSEQSQFQSSRQKLSSVMPEALDGRGRYFALGFDSYKILTQLSILQAFPEYRWSGLGGELAVDENGLVHRFLTWAQFNRGVPFVTKEREVRQREESNTGSSPTPSLFLDSK
ncbi:ABC transporter substrate-binding protein [Aliikangiella marina]|uniref:ABC transporter substrate-binding protein n=1 Tax=Aliikangiella marina TaxID=1712262 RepID=A0A545T6J7_9GAMM|nr:penicillin-binding protein activator [Aliikangiella marina]TQV72843.1 ABC transporter substrate-binding protein [Aliikangiella marina]